MLYLNQKIKIITEFSRKKTFCINVIFKKIGIKWRKVNSVPAKVNIDAQQKFHDESSIFQS